MGKITLIIMAAGIGSRFGGGIKQLEPVGPNGEIIMDYSIKDALKAGFNKVVFVIRKDIEEEFRQVIGKRIERIVEVDYVFQELDNIPNKYKKKFPNRTKPWGTGQAILCCKEVVKEPFLVINADDYYGGKAYEKAYKYLMRDTKDSDKLNICMVGFLLKNTLSDNGGVTRGVCQVNKERMLTDIVETHNIVKSDKGAQVISGDSSIEIDIESEVSMNMWGLRPEIFGELEEGFNDFLENISLEDSDSEYLLPTIIGKLLEEDKVEVEVLQTKDKWFGVTYKEDKEAVIQAIKSIVC
ncbi:nucleotidyltransferase family protein [[Clostridium] scindens]|uniref:nucleotidyltransferase family protein n=1 Tax=Clostridium scindens (strain JCM 10418 / VPI 12708) TaxID=29347 RepID=UPI0039A1D13D